MNGIHQDPRQRLQPGGAIVVVMTRWNMKDLTGMLLKSQKELKSDQWEIIEFPAIMPSGKTCLARVLEVRRIRRCQKLVLVLVNGMHNGCKILLQKKDHLLNENGGTCGRKITYHLCNILFKVMTQPF